MTLKEAADLASSLSLVVATVTFALAAYEHRQRERDKLKLERQKLVQNWQKVVVYRIIERGTTEFGWIKSEYLEKAQQLDAFDLPKFEIQDDALQLALMGLIVDRLISKTDQGRFMINVVSPDENIWKQRALEEMGRRQNANIIISKFRDTLETSSGQYTIERLYRLLKADELMFPFEHFDVLIRGYIQSHAAEIVIESNDKIWLRSKLPGQPRAPNPPQAQPQKES